MRAVEPGSGWAPALAAIPDEPLTRLSGMTMKGKDAQR